jgi:hypothetical protein
MTEQEKIDRGMQAAALLEHPLVKEALAAMTRDVLADFENADANDLGALQYQRLRLDAVKQFAQWLADTVMDGRNAATKAEHEPQDIE